MNVFIVDDSEVVRDRLSELLSDVQGLSVVGFAAGEQEAIGKLRGLVSLGTVPDVIILDLQLAEGSGIGVLKALRREGPRTRVVLLTGFAQPLIRQICLEQGADCFLDKFFELDRLEPLLRQWAAAH